ncbi:MAG: hypothetical protein AAFR13_01305, partial [Pseudomonadota bacterium]
AVLDDCGAEIAPIIGYGITQNRNHSAKITNPHGFSMEWLRLQPGQKVSSFSLADKMVLIPREAGLRISMNDTGDVAVDMGAWDTLSVPAEVMRSMQNHSDTAIEVLVIVTGDHQKRPEFRGDIIEKAFARDSALDAQGYVAAAHLIPVYGMVAE